MINELEILRSVDEENRITQRELAKRTGLSLGAVNVLIKRLIHKGLIKIEHINSRTIKYILTPKGLMEKARLTYQYIVQSYNYISNIEIKLEQIMRSKKETEKVILYGIKDEVYDIITAKLKAIGEEFEYIEKGGLNCFLEKEYIIITWHPEDIENNINENLNVVSILK